MTLFTSCLRNGLLIVAVLATSLVAQAQTADYPDKPIRLAVPYPPGGGTDVIARIMQEPMQALQGQPRVIENVGRAGGPREDERCGYCDTAHGCAIARAARAASGARISRLPAVASPAPSP